MRQPMESDLDTGRQEDVTALAEDDAVVEARVVRKLDRNLLVLLLVLCRSRSRL